MRSEEGVYFADYGLDGGELADGDSPMRFEETHVVRCNGRLWHGGWWRWNEEEMKKLSGRVPLQVC